MTATADGADLALGLDFGYLREETVDERRERVLDSVGVAVPATDAEPVGVVGDAVAAFGGEGARCVAAGGRPLRPQQCG